MHFGDKLNFFKFLWISTYNSSFHHENIFKFFNTFFKKYNINNHNDILTVCVRYDK